jgi:hypothetical protein
VAYQLGQHCPDGSHQIIEVISWTSKVLEAENPELSGHCLIQSKNLSHETQLSATKIIPFCPAMILEAISLH